MSLAIHRGMLSKRASFPSTFLFFFIFLFFYDDAMVYDHYSRGHKPQRLKEGFLAETYNMNASTHQHATRDLPPSAVLATYLVHHSSSSFTITLFN